MKYRLKPTAPKLIDAVQITHSTFETVPNEKHILGVFYDPVRYEVSVPIFGGTKSGGLNDWIVVHADGQFDVLTDELFKYYYEPATVVDPVPSFKTVTIEAPVWPTDHPEACRLFHDMIDFRLADPNLTRDKLVESWQVWIKKVSDPEVILYGLITEAAIYGRHVGFADDEMTLPRLILISATAHGLEPFPELEKLTEIVQEFQSRHPELSGPLF